MRITPLRALLPFALALVLVGAGCGKESTPAPAVETPSESPAASEPSTSGEPTAEIVPATKPVNIGIRDFKFVPSQVTVKRGTTVTWTQEDSVPHTVTADRKAGLDSPLLKKGETYSYKFEKTGTFSYHCTPHPNMKGKVVVEEE